MDENKINLTDLLRQEGYLKLRQNKKGWCGLRLFMFTIGLCYGLDEEGYAGRYCYDNLADAVAALNAWDGDGHPPGNWIKHKGAGMDERNPNRRP